MKIYGVIDDGAKLQPSDFITRYEPILASILELPDVKIIFHDGVNTALLGRFLRQRGFREATLYHLGDKPRSNLGSFPTRSFTTFTELEESLIDMATDLIRLEN